MNISDLTDPNAVESAIAEYDKLGREQFLQKYSFGPAKAYFLVKGEKRYDSKAIVGAAISYQYPDQPPLTASDFSGGDATVRRKLERLGFQVIVEKSSQDEQFIPVPRQILELQPHWSRSNASEIVEQELERRKSLWEQLLKNGGPLGVAANTLHELGIYGGAQGIWVDKARTGSIVQPGYGVAVSLTHSGTSYPDDWSDNGVIYHYPDTRRPKGRDLSEIEATKNAKRLGLPVFIITHTSHSKRNVYIGQVTDWDDTSKQFLVLFDEEFSMTSVTLDKPLEEIDEKIEFNLFQKEQRSQRTVRSRNNQQRFKFDVLKRYGPRCAACGIEVLALLQAAHIVPKEHDGSDDPRNGLPLCANHHLAFDTHLFVVKPETLEICYPQEGINAKTLQIPFNDLCHLPHLPHNDAIKWRYDRWKQDK